jgi:PIN domain nuclease of toxin-antitoxin system
MQYLIDTQILIWSIISPEKLNPKIKEILENNEIFISQISLFEIAIKQKIGKLEDFNIPINELVLQIVSDGFQLLNLTNDLFSNYKNIPLYSEHKDSFDRLLLNNTF